MGEKRFSESAQINRQIVRKALKEFQSTLAEVYSAQTPGILIYGSYARRQEHDESDVDLLLIFNHKVHPAEEIQRLSAILADLNLRYHLLISILPVAQDRFEHSQESFWKNVRRDGIPTSKL